MFFNARTELIFFRESPIIHTASNSKCDFHHSSLIVNHTSVWRSVMLTAEKQEDSNKNIIIIKNNNRVE